MWVSSIRPGVEVERLAESNSIKARAEWNILRYTLDELNAFEHYYDLDLAHSGDRYRLDFSGSYKIQTTLTSELGESGILTQLNRHQWLAAPSVTYQLTPLQRVSLSYQFQDVEYEEKKNVSAFTDYRYHTLSGDWRYQWTPGTEVSVTAFGSRYKPVDFALHSETLGLQGGVEHSFSETLQAGAVGGIRYTMSESNGQVVRGFTIDSKGRIVPVIGEEKSHSQDVGFIFSGHLTKTLERGYGSIELSQNVAPQGTGGLVQRLQATFRLNYELYERWRGIFRATALRNETISSSDSLSNRTDRTYFSVAPELRWQWTEEIFLGFAYTYRYQKFKSIDQPATSNEFMLRLIYQPLRVR